MERESFEDEDIAAYLKEHYISIKVDREERPDLDALYMSAVQRMTGSGGWPMTVFLTPALEPFYGGTYFPPKSKYGRPGFMDLLHGIQYAWLNKHEQILKDAHQMSSILKVEFPTAVDHPLPTRAELKTAYQNWLPFFANGFDPTWGGFGKAPKFPPSGNLLWLFQASRILEDPSESENAMHMAELTLEKMASGGMYDQIGGGFARYSVDEYWRVPHFEKMLYDQGTLISAYLEGWRTTGNPRFARIASECCDYLLRERQDPAGGFWSATDADSEGEEGIFFAWTPKQLEEVLGEKRGKFATAFYGVSLAGTFEHGMSVLQVSLSALEAAEAAGIELLGSSNQQRRTAAEKLAQEVRSALYEARLKRIPPNNDDKILTAWNGLAIHALAQAGRLLNQPTYTDAAARAADFIMSELRKTKDAGNWTLYRSWRGGQAQHRAVLEDYAYFARALLSLFQSTGEERWLHQAELLADRMLKDFWDEDSAIFWNTDGKDATVLHRLKGPWDGAIPSANSIALEALLGLHAFTLKDKWRLPAHRGLGALKGSFDRSPNSFSYALRLLPLAVEEPSVAVVIGDGTSESLVGWSRALNSPESAEVWQVFRADAAPESKLGLFQNRSAVKNKATLYLCKGATCQLPETNPALFGNVAPKEEEVLKETDR
jgi:uncharacterized protein YyaL (SSP411 family)